jgi:tetratricopeptide (TPR) repeat protein
MKAQSTDSYLETPIFISNDSFEIADNPFLKIPNQIDQRIEEINRVGVESSILQEIERRYKVSNLIKFGTDAQAMGSHRHAVAIGLKAIKLLKPPDPDQIKKAIYETLIFSHLYLYQWLESQTYIDLAKPLDKDPLYYPIYAVIANLGQKKNQVAQSLFLDIWKKMQMQFENHKSYLPTFNEGLLHLAEFLGEASFESFVKKIYEIGDYKNLSDDNQARFLTDIGNFTADIGDYNFSEFLYSRAFEINTDNTIKASVLNGIGTIKVNMGQYQEAIQKFKEAIGLDNQNSLFYQNLAFVYSEIFDYQKAIENIDKAIALDHSSNLPLDELLWKKFDIMRMNSGYIHIDSVKSQTARNHFQQAEFSLYTVLRNKDLQFNANQLISELANGIDAILQDKLMPPLIRELNSVYGSPPNIIPKELWRNYAIQNMRKGKSVNLGEWLYLTSELIKIPINPIYQPLRTTLNIYSNPELYTIGAGTKKLAEWRNPNVHGAIISLNDYMEKRVEIISVINHIIDIIYKET